MSSYVLHIASAGRFDNRTTIAGDRTALLCLRSALDEALLTGSGGAALYSSDGERHAVAIVRAEDMAHVCTTYAGEINPSRSKRETVHIKQLPYFLNAQWKADRLPIPADITSTHC